ncbi:MAG: hypothetical protein AB7P40_00385 [Chloroflexota bacterium]
MADPRMTTTNVGTNAEYGSFDADAATIVYSATVAGGASAVGLAVTMTSTAKTISTTADAEPVLGKLISVEPDGTCTVQVGGVMELPGGTAATLNEGTRIVGALGGASGTAEGYIRSVGTAAAEAHVGRGMIEDGATATAVVVRL